LLKGDPLLDRPESPPPGWFAAVEFDIVGVHIKNRLQAQVTIDGFSPDTVHLPTAELDWTGSPRIELGYRLSQGCGEFLIAYQGLQVEGSATAVGFDLDGSDGILHSSLELHAVDFDYSSREYSLSPHWDMKWKVGARLATLFFDSQATGVFFEQRTSNYFVGAGPHVGLDLWRSFDWQGLAFFTRIEGASLIGRIGQSFEEVAVANDGSLLGAATRQEASQVVPVLRLQVGLSYSPCWWGHWSRYALGYEFEQWWYIGQVQNSSAELTVQGIFLRGEFAF
jgi:hypothetical protein